MKVLLTREKKHGFSPLTENREPLEKLIEEAHNCYVETNEDEELFWKLWSVIYNRIVLLVVNENELEHFLDIIGAPVCLNEEMKRKELELPFINL